LREVSLSPDLLGVVLGLLILCLTVFGQLVERASRGTENVRLLEVCSTVVLLLGVIVCIVHSLLELSLLPVVGNLSVVVETPSDLVATTLVSHQIRGVS